MHSVLGSIGDGMIRKRVLMIIRWILQRYPITDICQKAV